MLRTPGSDELELIPSTEVQQLADVSMISFLKVIS